MKNVWVGIVIVVVFLGLFGSCTTNEYEEAGKTFGEWTRKDPSTWTDTQKDYFDDFMDWSSKN